MWELPEFARFLDRLAAMGRLLLFDKRGTGLSDRIAGVPALERRADDIAAVMDAAGSSRAAIAAWGEGAAIAAMFAATPPRARHVAGSRVVADQGDRRAAVGASYFHDQRAAESTVDAILANNGNAVAVRADIADDLDVKRLFAETIAAFGGIDVVVHAAGSRITASDVTKVGLDEFDALVRINTRATFIVNQQAAQHLRNGGAIVNLSSSADGS
jgi:3-oxoacyl-[acyl-carrier protein] reductase